MTVRQLIAELEKLPQDLLCVSSGYEGGMTEVTGAVTLDVLLNCNPEWYYGEHENDYSEADAASFERATVVRIAGRRH